MASPWMSIGPVAIGLLPTAKLPMLGLCASTRVLNLPPGRGSLSGWVGRALCSCPPSQRVGGPSPFFDPGQPGPSSSPAAASSVWSTPSPCAALGSKRQSKRRFGKWPFGVRPALATRFRSRRCRGHFSQLFAGWTSLGPCDSAPQAPGRDLTFRACPRKEVSTQGVVGSSSCWALRSSEGAAQLPGPISRDLRGQSGGPRSQSVQMLTS